MDQCHEKWHTILDGIKVHCLVAGSTGVCSADWEKDVRRRTFRDEDALPHVLSYIMHSAIAVEVPSFLRTIELVC